jgi:hypothetical protein
MTKGFNLAGKDWFTEQEAAFYCCVSASQFAHHYEDLGITPRKFMGRKLYSREELSAVISQSNPWHVTQMPIRTIPGQGNAHERTVKFCEALRKAKTQEEKDALLDSLGPGAASTSPLDAYRRRGRN